MKITPVLPVLVVLASMSVMTFESIEAAESEEAIRPRPVEKKHSEEPDIGKLCRALSGLCNAEKNVPEMTKKYEYYVGEYSCKHLLMLCEALRLLPEKDME
ncbi:hypothetical protein GE061_014857 [Apolygus lucorum]|uniref:Uncharacterized protein n=1 Tax=Apolygus lucorum TaxID=248454 RepID=A0A8S9XKL2_APOLU|nr:hypothetical protein GE061_014857 [Apolygus lucorum]